MVGFIYFFSFRKSCGTCPARLQLPAEREGFLRLKEIVIDISVFYYNFARKRIEGLKN